MLLGIIAANKAEIKPVIERVAQDALSNFVRIISFEFRFSDKSADYLRKYKKDINADITDKPIPYIIKRLINSN
jgi:hypothetical protein